jgi:hypothetical protein
MATGKRPRPSNPRRRVDKNLPKYQMTASVMQLAHSLHIQEMKNLFNIFKN